MSEVYSEKGDDARRFMSDDSSKLSDNEFRQHLESVRVKEDTVKRGLPIAFDKWKRDPEADKDFRQKLKEGIGNLHEDDGPDYPYSVSMTQAQFDWYMESQASKAPSNDEVSHPYHYTTGKIEVKDYIADKGFNFFLGNVVKYVSRAGLKGDALTDLKKARQYLDFEIERLSDN